MDVVSHINACDSLSILHSSWEFFKEAVRVYGRIPSLSSIPLSFKERTKCTANPAGSWIYYPVQPELSLQISPVIPGVFCQISNYSPQGKSRINRGNEPPCQKKSNWGAKGKLGHDSTDFCKKGDMIFLSNLTFKKSPKTLTTFCNLPLPPSLLAY